MKIACVQNKILESKEYNLKNVCTMISDATTSGADIVVLPEMFACPNSRKYFHSYAEPKGELIYSTLQEAADKNNIVLVGGSMPELSDGRVYNTSFVFDKNGNELAGHRKMFLFDIHVEGGKTFRESDTISPGNKITKFTCQYGTFGLMVCFDISFVEPAYILAKEGVSCIFVPASFSMDTGPYHWETTFRQRALDNQLFVIGCASARNEDGPGVSYSHSIITNPWGSIVAMADTSETILYADIDLNMVEDIRQQLPLLSASRQDLFSITYML